MLLEPCSVSRSILNAFENYAITGQYASACCKHLVQTFNKWDVRKDKIRLQHTGEVWFHAKLNFNLDTQRDGLKYVLIASKKKNAPFLHFNDKNIGYTWVKKKKKKKEMYNKLLFGHK